MASSNSLSSLTEDIDELPYRQSSPDDSHAPTTPLQRTFSGDVQAEASGKRVRPDNTSRGIGPQSIAEDAKTIDVSSADLQAVSKDISLSELRVPFMHGGPRFLVLIALGAIALVGGMLLLMTRSEEQVNASKAEPLAPVAAPAPMPEPAPALVAERQPSPAPSVAPAVPAKPEEVAAPVTAEKPRATAKRRVRSKSSSKLASRVTATKATTKAKAKKGRSRTQPAATR